MTNYLPSKKDIGWISLLIISTLIIYGYSFFNFTMSIDNEYMELFAQKISIGRWGGAFLKETILPAPYAPFFTHLIMCAFLCLSAIITAKLLNFSNFYAGIFSILCISFPSFFYQADFAMQSDAVGIGMFFGVISSCFIVTALENKMSRADFIIKISMSVIFYCLSISIYQSLFTTGIGITILFYAKKHFENEKTLNSIKILYLFIWCALSFFSYVVLTKLIQIYLNIPGSSYLFNQVGWFNKPNDVNIQIIKDKFITLILGHDFYGEQLFIITTIFAAVYIAIIALKRKGVMSGILAIAAYIIPFALVFILASDLPPRTFTFQSFVYAYFICMIASLFSSYNHLNKVIVFYCVVSVWSGSFIYSKLMFSDYMSWQADKILASQIINNIRNSIPEYHEGTTPVYFHGALNRKNVWKPENSDVFGNSFFQWDGGNNSRIREFFRVNMIANIASPAKKEAISLFPKIKEMPSWPDKESISFIDGIVIVKFSDRHGYLGGMKP